MIHDTPRNSRFIEIYRKDSEIIILSLAVDVSSFVRIKVQVGSSRRCVILGETS